MTLRTWIRDKLWHKEWTPEDLDKYVGADVRGCYFTYAADETLRERASSGGSVSALLVHLLETGQADGALVCRTVIKKGKPRPEFFIAESREAIIAAQGSKYAAVFFAATALPLIRAYTGRVAVVALPCDAKILHTYREKHPEVDARITHVITLFCGHNSEPALVDHVVEKLGAGHGPLVDYTFRYGHWRCKLRVTFADGATEERPFSAFSDYRNLYLFAQAKCHYCHDHYGYFCDISAGDIWSPEMKAEPIKHTALLTRSARGEVLLHAATEAGALVSRPEPLVRVANGQARTMPFHYNVTSRARVGRLFGLDIPDHTREKVRWNDYLVAFMALLNERISRNPRFGRLIFRLPRPVIRLYLLVLKALESF